MREQVVFCGTREEEKSPLSFLPPAVVINLKPIYNYASSRGKQVFSTYKQ